MMKRNALIAAALLAGAAIGYGAARFVGADGDNAAPAGEGGRKIAYYKAPMDPNFRSDKPGKSPMGMDLIPVYEDELAAGAGGKTSSVNIDASVVNNIGVRTAKVEYGSLRPSIRTVGRIEYDEERVASFHLRSSGWIERLNVRAEGEPVRKGDLLFEVYSPDLVNAQAEFLQALRSGRPQYVEAGKDRLRALDISEQQIATLEKSSRVQQYVRFYAPISGVVTALNVADGQYVKPDTEIMALADLSTVWLISDVFESDADQLRTGARVVGKSKFEPGTTIEGEVDYIYPDLDPKTRTIPVRTVLDNSDGDLKPGMFMTVSIAAPQRAETTIIPREALIRTGRQERVILALDRGQFQPAAVTSGVEADGKVEILSGLNAGETVVVSGQFLIDSESNFSGAALRMQPVRHDHEGDGAGGAQGVGVINRIGEDGRTVNMTHDPIAAIDWPAMTMDLPLAESVSADALEVGANVEFTLAPKGDSGGYEITSITAVEPAHAHDAPSYESPPDGAANATDHSLLRTPSDEITPEAADEQMDHSAHGAPSATEKPLVKAFGVVKTVSPAEKKITVAHDAIPEIGWPAMTMDFPVSDSMDLAAVPTGRRIAFLIRETGDSRYVVDAVEAAQ
ncbi:efflux RND transporter periplasmic adaptor subunit [Hyphococcus sp.]|uniref:efflux RND transporter periplasmic adaptor subunit n=1 Tax=Hyphococcus sp. TaxID=2038636 RepID=UPI003D0FB02F